MASIAAEMAAPAETTSAMAAPAETTSAMTAPAASTPRPGGVWEQENGKAIGESVAVIITSALPAVCFHMFSDTTQQI